MRQLVERVTQKLDWLLVQLMWSVAGREGLERRLRLFFRYYLRFGPPVVAVGTAVGILMVFLSIGEPVGLAVTLSVVAGVPVYVGLRIVGRNWR